MSKILSRLLALGLGCICFGCTDYANYVNRDAKATDNPDIYIEKDGKYRYVKPSDDCYLQQKIHPCYGAGDKAEGTGTQVKKRQ